MIKEPLLKKKVLWSEPSTGMIVVANPGSAFIIHDPPCLSFLSAFVEMLLLNFLKLGSLITYCDLKGRSLFIGVFVLFFK